jgi:hypothetical protein
MVDQVREGQPMIGVASSASVLMRFLLTLSPVKFNACVNRIRAIIHTLEFRTGLIWSLGILLGVTILVGAWHRFRKRRLQCWPGPPNDNGIGIGRPKLYDTRSLSLLLEEMQEQLRRLNNISQKPLTDAQGTTQAQETTTLDVSLDATVSNPPVSGTAPRRRVLTKRRLSRQKLQMRVKGPMRLLVQAHGKAPIWASVLLTC